MRPLRTKHLVRTVARASSGNISIAFAFVLIIIVAFVGSVVDFSRAWTAQNSLQIAADAAVLAAAQNPAMTDILAAHNTTSYAHSVVNTNGITGLNSKVVRNTAGGTTTATVTLNANVRTTFLGVTGIAAIPISAVSKATVSNGELEIYAAIDMSGSLGLAADPANRAALKALTKPYTLLDPFEAAVHPNGCQFACHRRQGWEPAGLTTYDMASNAGIQMREDVLASAFSSFATTFLDPADPAVAANLKRIGVIGFSDAAQLLLLPSNNATAVGLSLNSFPGANRWNTKFGVALPAIQTMMGAQGSGAVGSPMKALLLVTDGMDYTAFTPPPAAPLDVALCDSFKQSGFTVAVIDVKYLDSTGEYYFDQNVAAAYPHVSPALQACASPGFYFLASDSTGADLANAFSGIAKKLQTQLTLTQ